MAWGQNTTEEFAQNWDKYQVVAVKNGNESVRSYSNTIEIAKPVNIFAPNAFSPDNDGINDLFFIAGGGIEEFVLEIFNRWGEIIFSSNDINEHWDGTHEGTDVPQGSYVYQVKGRSVDGSASVLKSGTVALVR